MKDLNIHMLTSLLYYLTHIIWISYLMAQLEIPLASQLIVGIISYLVIFLILTGIAILPAGPKGYGTPFLFLQAIILKNRFKKIKGDSCDDLWMVYTKYTFSIIKIGLFTSKVISNSSKYTDDTDFQKLISEKIKDYVNDKQILMSKIENVNEWDGCIDLKSSRNNKLDKII